MHAHPAAHPPPPCLRPHNIHGCSRISRGARSRRHALRAPRRQPSPPCAPWPRELPPPAHKGVSTPCGPVRCRVEKTIRVFGAWRMLAAPNAGPGMMSARALASRQDTARAGVMPCSSHIPPFASSPQRQKGARHGRLRACTRRLGPLVRVAPGRYGVQQAARGGVRALAQRAYCVLALRRSSSSKPWESDRESPIGPLCFPNMWTQFNTLCAFITLPEIKQSAVSPKTYWSSCSCTLQVTRRQGWPLEGRKQTMLPDLRSCIMDLTA